MSSTQAMHLFISGRVQGVSYRYATHNQALSLGLKGWVRNLSDGRVEVWIEGSETLQNKLLTWCYEGPAFAHVSHIDIQNVSSTSLCETFKIK